MEILKKKSKEGATVVGPGAGQEVGEPGGTGKGVGWGAAVWGERLTRGVKARPGTLFSRVVLIQCGGGEFNLHFHE